MKKGILTLLSMLLLLALASGCSAGALSEAFDEETVIARAKEVVGTINTLDYEAVCGEVREDLQAQVSAEDLKSAWDEKLSASGAFQDYKSVAVVGQKDEATGGDMAIAVLNCTYENGSATFTLIFDTSMELTGLYMK